MIELAIASVNQSPQSKWPVQPFLHSSRQKVHIFTMGSSSSQNYPFPWGDLDPHLIHGSLGPPSSQRKHHHDRFSHFCIDNRRVSLYFTIGCPVPLSKLSPPMGGSGPPSSTWFPGPTQVLNPNSILIGSAIFAGPTSVTDRQTTLLCQ